MRIWDKVKDIAAFLIMGVVGVGLLIFAMFGFVIPAQEKKKRDQAKGKAEALKKKVEEVKAARDAKVEEQVVAIKEETAAKKEEDPVDFANDLIRKG